MQKFAYMQKKIMSASIKTLEIKPFPLSEVKSIAYQNTVLHIKYSTLTK